MRLISPAKWGARLAAVLLSLTLPVAAEEVTVPLAKVQAEDGDTLIADLNGAPKRIQLLGIDAPESGDNPKLAKDLERTKLDRARLIALGEAATAHLTKLIADGDNLQFTYDPEKPDRYKRPQGMVKRGDERSLSHAMVADGYALVTDSGSPFIEELRKLEIQARDEGAGIWGLDPEAAQAWAGR